MLATITCSLLNVKDTPPSGYRRTHHGHVRLPQDTARELAFRDLLRADAAFAREYERLKERLAARYGTGRDAYTDGKAAFIAKRWRSVPAKHSSGGRASAQRAELRRSATCLQSMTTLRFRSANTDDAALLVTTNAQLICDEGHRNHTSESELAQRMITWLRSDYRA